MHRRNDRIRSRIDYREVAALEARRIEASTGGVDREALEITADRNRGHHGARVRIDHTDGAGAAVGDVHPGCAGRNGAGSGADGNRRHDASGGDIDHRDVVAGLVGDIRLGRSEGIADRHQAEQGGRSYDGDCKNDSVAPGAES